MKKTFQDKKHALGSEAVLTIVLPSHSQFQAAGLFESLWTRIRSFEERFSRFIPSSELTSINSQSGMPTPISLEMQGILASALRYFQETSGLFDPAVLYGLEKAGYDRSLDDPSLTSVSTLKSPPTHLTQDIRLEEGKVFLPAGTRLDLGGIGKGYLLDQLDSYLKPHCPDYWLSLGGDLRLSGSNEQDGPWKIGIQNPHDPDSNIGEFVADPLQPIAVATSGTFKRAGTKDGQAWHHLIDPRTNKPAQTDLLAATVIGPTATTADILASCCVIAGTTEAEKVMLKHPDYAALCFTRSQDEPPQWYGQTTYNILVS